MKKEELLETIKQGVSHVHDDIFKSIDVDEILSGKDYKFNIALDKYTQYFNYSENPDEYNLKYCFKETIRDLNQFYEFQEQKMELIKNNERLCEVEHNINEHIYDEVILCQKKVNRLYLFNAFSSYFIAFLLIFAITELTHLFEAGTLIGSTIVAAVMALVKIVIDHRYLEPVRKRIGWKSYRLAIRRSLAFYFASVIVLNQCQHQSINFADQSTIVGFKKQVRESIDILLEDIIVNDIKD